MHDFHIHTHTASCEKFFFLLLQLSWQRCTAMMLARNSKHFNSPRAQWNYKIISGRNLCSVCVDIYKLFFLCILHQSLCYVYLLHTHTHTFVHYAILYSMGNWEGGDEICCCHPLLAFLLSRGAWSCSATKNLSRFCSFRQRYTNCNSTAGAESNTQKKRVWTWWRKKRNFMQKKPLFPMLFLYYTERERKYSCGIGVSEMNFLLFHHFHFYARAERSRNVQWNCIFLPLSLSLFWWGFNDSLFFREKKMVFMFGDITHKQRHSPQKLPTIDKRIHTCTLLVI